MNAEVEAAIRSNLPWSKLSQQVQQVTQILNHVTLSVLISPMSPSATGQLVQGVREGRGQLQHQEPGPVPRQPGQAGQEGREEVLRRPAPLQQDQPDALSLPPVRRRRQGHARHAVPVLLGHDGGAHGAREELRLVAQLHSRRL